jgi:hypothetical protein
MKHLVLSFTILLWISQAASAQDKKALAASLDRDLVVYKQHSLALNFDSIFQFMPPKMFDILPPDSLRASMVKAMDNEYLSIEMTGLEYTGKPKIKKAGAYQWAFVHYEGSMVMHFKESRDSTFNGLLLLVMKNQFGKENVQSLNEKDLRVMLRDKQLIAFKDPSLPRWCFIEDKRKSKGRDADMQRMIIETVLPPEVLKAIGKK